MILLLDQPLYQGGRDSLRDVNSEGEHALWLAAAHGNEETVSVLAKHDPGSIDLVAFPPTSGEGGGGDESGGGAKTAAATNASKQGGIAVPQPTTALMAAAYFGHAGVVRALHAAKADLSQFSEPNLEVKDALLLATRDGHLPVVRLLTAANKGRGRLGEAKALAEKLLAEHGDGPRHEQYDQILKLIQKPTMRRNRTNSRIAREIGKQRSKDGMTEGEQRVLDERIRANVASLKWNKDVEFTGQIVPPRPSEAELARGETLLGPLVKDGGVVVQGGPFGSTWLRAGCLRVPWHTLWRTLKAYVEALLEAERLKTRPGAVYVVVSLRSMQSIDFTWLADRGFRFHHHRAPGHGATPPNAIGDGAGDGAGGAAEAEAAGAAAGAAAEVAVTIDDAPACGGASGAPSVPPPVPPVAPPTPDVGESEYVYYAWPGDTDDMVPVYSTSVEGATALVFSPDETRLLLVWERGGWSTPGGAVNAGEGKLDALAREVGEEVGVALDEEWEGVRFLGGYQQEKARDGLVNDSFAAFSVKATTDEFVIDGKEIRAAHWVAWRPLLERWIASGRPQQKRVAFEGFGELVGLAELKPEKNLVMCNVLHWLETWVDGRGFSVARKRSQQGKDHVTKALFNACF